MMIQSNIDYILGKNTFYISVIYFYNTIYTLFITGDISITKSLILSCYMYTNLGLSTKKICTTQVIESKCFVENCVFFDLVIEVLISVSYFK